jgi:hypothetical protein
MSTHHTGLRIGFAAAALLLLGSAASAQTARQECGIRYHAAKSEGTLGGLTWPQFFSRCMMEARAKEPKAAPSQAPKAEETTEETTPKPEEAPEASTPSTEAEPAETPAAETGKATPTENADQGEAEAAPAESTDSAPASDDAATTEAPAPAAEPDSDATAAEPKPPEAPAETPAASETPEPEPKPALPEAAAEPPAGPVFPTAISSAYAKDGPEIARKKTCLEQFKANKATGGNAGLRWIQKGGGYFSLCDQHLKGKH